MRNAGWSILIGAAAAACTPAPLPAPEPERGMDLAAAELPELDRGGDRDRDRDRPINTPAKTPQVLPLGDDLAPQPLDLPAIPLGTTASFEVDASARGWITRVAKEAIPTAAYGDRKIYVGSGFTSRAIHALDATTGHVEWSHRELADDGPTAPIYEDGKVIFNTESCTLFVIDAKTGRTSWSKYLGDPTLSQPAMKDGVIYAAFPEGGTTKLGAFRAEDGEKLWAHSIGAELYSAPVIDGDAIYLTTLGGRTLKLARSSGLRLWSSSDSATSAPSIARGVLFQSRARAGVEQQVARDAETGELLRVLRTAEAFYLADVPRALGDNPRIWGFEGSRPVFAGGRRFDTMGGEIEASDPHTGAALWKRKHGATRAARTLTAPVVAGAKLVFATYDGDVYGLDVDTGLTVFAYRLGVPIRAQPIVAFGWIYVSTTTGSVIGLPAGDRSLDGWHMWGGSPAHNG